MLTNGLGEDLKAHHRRLHRLPSDHTTASHSPPGSAAKRRLSDQGPLLPTKMQRLCDLAAAEGGWSPDPAGQDRLAHLVTVLNEHDPGRLNEHDPGRLNEHAPGRLNEHAPGRHMGSEVSDLFSLVWVWVKVWVWVWVWVRVGVGVGVEFRDWVGVGCNCVKDNAPRIITLSYLLYTLSSIIVILYHHPLLLLRCRCCSALFCRKRKTMRSILAFCCCQLLVSF